MNGDASPSVSPQLQIARQILARDLTPDSARSPDAVGAGLQRTLTRLSDSLRDALGDDGCSALLARALARTEQQHPALNSVRRLNDDSIYLDGVVQSVETHGAASVAAAVEALLAALVEILGRLIGEDMTIRIMDYDSSRSRTSEGRAP